MSAVNRSSRRSIRDFDPFVISNRQSLAAICQTARQLVDPEPSVMVEGYLNGGGASRNVAMAGQSTVCSMRTRREKDTREASATAMIVPIQLLGRYSDPRRGRLEKPNNLSGSRPIPSTHGRGAEQGKILGGANEASPAAKMRRSC